MEREQAMQKSHFHQLVFFLFLALLSGSSADMNSKIGINYGQQGDNLPSAFQSIQLMKSLKATRVKLYNADPEVLTLLSGSKMQVSIMIPNQEISHIASNQTVADQWVEYNILPFYPETKIRLLLVGNEVLSYYTDEDKQTWNNLVPAMRRIKRSLKIHDMGDIKVSTPLAMDILQSSFPPSNGTFRSDISRTIMEPLLSFLNRTRSFFCLDVYPYFPWSSNPTGISLDYALLNGNENVIDRGTNLTYTNLLDQMLDSVIFAMTKLGYPDIRLLISETGWPSAGDFDQIGANIDNAAIYNRNLVKKITSKRAVGTPARPGAIIPTFIFALFNENQKVGPGTERNWGLLHPNGSKVYEVDLTGKQDNKDENNASPTAGVPYKGNLWCVAASDGDGNVKTNELASAIAFACGQGNATCDALMPGKECYEPLSLLAHASYAFNSYWVQFRSSGATCYFNGLGVQTTKDPSHGSCKFPSVTV